MLDEATSCCRDLLRLWASIERAVAPLPHTLVHGSFSRRNMLVTSTASGPLLRVFDWGAAGWGVPARDLTKLFSPTIAGAVATYWRRFPDVAASDREPLIAVGRLFRAIEHMTWVTQRHSYSCDDEPMGRAAAPAVDLVAARDALRRLV